MGTRSIGRFSARKFGALAEAGRYSDGGGLYLQIGAGGARSWIFRFQLNGMVRDMGLGSAAIIGLADARGFAGDCRALVARGIDPIAERRQRQQARALQAASALTFEQCARAVIEAKRSSWRSAKHAAQWERSLETYAFPLLGKLPVGEIDTELVIKVLGPIWETKNKTAGRIRERIETVLDAAKARGARKAENSARWRGHLENLLAKPRGSRQVRHHPALPYTEIGSFVALLRSHTSTPARALEFLILTATRTNETLGAQWAEIDAGRAVWIIPGTRIKTGREHKIPLTAPALALLKKLHDQRVNDYVFPGKRGNKPLCHMVFSKLLSKMERSDVTAHGFRSTFKDWASEKTNFPREVSEMALSHAIGSQVEAAYRRGDLLGKREKLMAAWAAYCDKPIASAAVLPFKIQVAG